MSEEKKVEKKAEKRERKKKEMVSDMDELREVLQVVRGEVPGLLKDLAGPIKEIMGIAFTTTTKEAEERAKAIAAFYKELVAAGIDKETALEMTKGNFINPVELIKEFSQGFIAQQKVRGDIAQSMFSKTQKKKSVKPKEGNESQPSQ
ncbi:MAG: hypothetical protein NWF14_02390 [Candidatus Bathyarchaeota archaeon]|nr:hypothetical protein [Candidatus Bathyarchaeota archaeon]